MAVITNVLPEALHGEAIRRPSRRTARVLRLVVGRRPTLPPNWPQHRPGRVADGNLATDAAIGDEHTQHGGPSS